MARIIATKDEPAQSAYFAGGDGFMLPEDARSIIKRHGGTYSSKSESWRLPLVQAPAVLAALRIGGHQIILDDPDAPRRVALECHECGAAYPSSKYVTPDEPCAKCGTRLVLVSAHVCGQECIENARKVPA